MTCLPRPDVTGVPGCHRRGVREGWWSSDWLRQLGCDGKAESLDRDPRGAPKPGQREGPGVEHRLELLVGGHRHALRQPLTAELPLCRLQAGVPVDLVEHQCRMLEPEMAERHLH